MRNILLAWNRSATRLIATSLAALISAASHAGIIQVSSPGELGPGPLTVEDFEKRSIFDLNPAATYSAPFFAVEIVLAGFYTHGGTPSLFRGLSTQIPRRPINIAFSSPASSVGLFFGNDDTCCASGFTAFMDIFGPGHLLLGTIGVEANMNDFADQFLGFTSDELVTSVTVRYGGNPNDLLSPVPLFTYIDDVMFNVAPAHVPEPPTLAALTLGLAALSLARRRAAARQTQRGG